VAACVGIRIAQMVENRWGIGARISYYDLSDTSIEGINFAPDSTALLEGNLTYFFNKMFSLDFSVGYTKPDVNAEAFGLSVGFGELEQIPITLTGRMYYWFSDSNTNLYFGGGVGYYLNDFELSSAFASVMPGFRLDADDSFGFHVNGGFEYFINDNVALDLDLKYIWNDSDFTAFQPGFPAETVNLDLDGFSAGIGIKYFF
jgi:outer membrane protein